MNNEKFLPSTYCGLFMLSVYGTALCCPSCQVRKLTSGVLLQVGTSIFQNFVAKRTKKNRVMLGSFHLGDFKRISNSAGPNCPKLDTAASYSHRLPNKGVDLHPLTTCVHLHVVGGFLCS